MLPNVSVSWAGVNRASKALREGSETERSIANKLSRGSFSFAFYLQCMRALGRADFRVDLTDVT
ncbi:DUF6471 domain-containing protein [Paraburkholderia youngii]|uniref:DUF6471 domain-containing protein n=1 Tax=Paraburkholderia youngii TaxID=2782701 RepID=UPI0028AF4013|nr:DUF6471 domain-containing protein [Paraburkholderia youngii]